MFLLAYIFTRPLGASFGDLLSQPKEYGGIGLATIITSVVFLGAIIALVAYMTVTQEAKNRHKQFGKLEVSHRFART